MMQAKTRAPKLTIALPPILQRIPVEIIAQIFQATIEPRGYNPVDVSCGPWICARICRIWREIALKHCQHMWAHVDVGRLSNLKPKKNMGELLDRALLYCPDVPMDVSYNPYVFSKRPTEGVYMLGSLILVSERWERAHLHLYPNSLPILVELDNYLPMLKQLTIGLENIHLGMKHHLGMFRNAPRLVDVTIAGCLGAQGRHVSFGLPFSQLQSYADTRWDGDGSIQQFRQLVELGSALRSIAFTHFKQKYGDEITEDDESVEDVTNPDISEAYRLSILERVPEVTPAADLPMLVNQSVKSVHVADESFLSSVSLPALEILTLGAESRWPGLGNCPASSNLRVSAAIKLIERSSCSLTKLTLVNVLSINATLIDLLRVTPLLQTFSLQVSVWSIRSCEITRQLVLEMHKEGLLPRLKSLVFLAPECCVYDRLAFVDGVFFDMIRTRWRNQTLSHVLVELALSLEEFGVWDVSAGKHIPGLSEAAASEWRALKEEGLDTALVSGRPLSSRIEVDLLSMSSTRSSSM